MSKFWPRSSRAGSPELRIAVVSPFVDKQHGTERVLAELLERLAVREDLEIRIYAQRIADLQVGTPSTRPEAAEPTGKILWRRISSIPGPHLLQFVWWYFANKFARSRDKKFRGFVPDLVYSPGINAADADAITVHIVFHAFYEQVRSQLRLFASSPLRWPRTIHRILYYRLIMALESRVYTNPAIAISAVSQLVAGQLNKFFGRPDVLVVRNAVDTHYFNARTRIARRDAARATFAIAPGEFVFLLIGNDWKKKGLDSILQALTECTDLPIQLLVVGNDDRKPYLRQCEALELGSRVSFLGPSADVLQFYAASDAYVGPSLEDAYGLPILESMACGLPVIASAAAGASEIVVDGENGLLLRDPRDVKLLASLMREICTSPGLANELGAAAERTAAKESWDVCATRMLEHFQQIVSQKKGPQRRDG
ncbi:MAG TPA: glycosyltransferase family 4 protein [Candidatus Dormibacteraeota bacterium]|nr:glycosyltransferase family 4 protein [Candidatus Dormibacteraeota bacterium]